MGNDPVESLDSDKSEIKRGRDRESSAEIVQGMSVTVDVIAMITVTVMPVTIRAWWPIHPAKIVRIATVTLSRDSTVRLSRSAPPRSLHPH